MGECGYLSWSEPTGLSEYREFVEGYKTPVFVKVKRLGSGNCWVLRDTANGTIVLQSYRTVVGMKVGATSDTIEFAKYSNTTNKHQSKFRKWCSEHPEAV